MRLSRPRNDADLVASLLANAEPGTVLELRGLGRCHLPLLPPGTLVRVERTATPPSPGQLVLMRDPARIHRLLRVDPSSSTVVTRADARRQEDAPQPASSLVAEVVAIGTPVGWIDLRGRVALRVNRALGVIAPLWPILLSSTSGLRRSLRRSRPAVLVRRTRFRHEGPASFELAEQADADAYLVHRSRAGLPCDAETLACVDEDLGRGGEIMLARIGGAVAGSARLTPREGWLYLSDLVVEKGWRDCGLASGLLRHAVSAARQRRLRGVYELVRTANVESLGAGRSAGFAVTQASDEWITLRRAV